MILHADGCIVLPNQKEIKQLERSRDVGRNEAARSFIAFDDLQYSYIVKDDGRPSVSRFCSYQVITGHPKIRSSLIKGTKLNVAQNPMSANPIICYSM